ncbi:cullin-9-like [Styela clava]
MKDSLQVGRNQVLEPKEILRQRNGASLQHVEYLVKWCFVSQNNSSVNHSDGLSSSDGKNDKNILIWMTQEEVEVCCSKLLGSGFTGLSNLTNKTSSSDVGTEDQTDDKVTATDTDSEDFEDMRDDVQKLVIRARRQMKKSENEEHKPIKNISYTLKVLSTYASLGSLASVFRQTGALDLILELLWSKEVETKRHAGKMLRALASHDGGSRAYVLLSLIQDRHGQMSSSDDDADFENRNTVMEMFAETSSGEEAHAVALDFMQLPQVPGKSLFKLMKCYLKVTSLLDMDSQFMQLMTGSEEKSFTKEIPAANPNVALFGNRKFEVTMAISDLIYELCEVMGWNNKQTTDDITVNQLKSSTKVPSEEALQKSKVISQYKKEFSQFMDEVVSHPMGASNNDFVPQNPLQELWRHMQKDLDSKENSMMSELLGLTIEKEDNSQNSGTAASSEPQLQSPISELKNTLKEGAAESILEKVNDSILTSPTLLLPPKKSHCIFSSKQKEAIDHKLLSDLIKRDTSLLRQSSIFRVPSSFATEEEYEQYVNSIIRQGWYVRAMKNEDEIEEGDEGIFRRFGHSSRKRLVAFWFRLGTVGDIHTKNVQIIGRTKEGQKNVSAKDAAKNLPDSFKSPENTKLWPILTGQDIMKLSCHPYSSELGKTSGERKKLGLQNSTQGEVLSERQWWEVLFYLRKLKNETKVEAFKEVRKIIEISDSEFLIDMKNEDLTVSDFKYCKFDAYQVLSLIRHIADFDVDAEMLFKKSTFCSRFLKPKSHKRKKLNELHADKTVSNQESTEKHSQASTSKDQEEDESAKDATTVDEVSEQKKAPDKVHDYLMFICRESTKFMESFVKYKTLREMFGDIAGQLDHLAEDTKSDEVLDHLPDADTKKQERVAAIIILHSILMKELQTPFSSPTLNSVLFKLQPIPQEDDLDLCIAWMECVRIILNAAHVHGPSKMRGAEVIVATSGCLVGIIRILKWFPTCIESTIKAIKCLSLATQAVRFHVTPESALRSSEAQIIRAVVDSIVSASDPSSDDEDDQKSELSAFFSGLNFVIDEIEKLLENPRKKDPVRWTDNESNTEVGALYEGICVCNFLITDHKELMKRTHQLIMPVIKRALQIAPSTSPTAKVINMVKSKIEEYFPPPADLGLFNFNKACVGGIDLIDPEDLTKLKDALENLLDPDNFNKMSPTVGKILNHLCVVLYDEQCLKSAQNIRLINTLFPFVLFPNMNLKMSADDLSQCVNLIEYVMFESNPSTSSGQTSVLAELLEEKHRPAAISALLQLIETLSASTLRPNLGSASTTQLKEIVSKTVALLQRIADVDRDSAVVMCGLDAKQFLSKAVEKYDSVPKASELIEFLASYERHRSLHSKLLVVVLGGTIGVALRCMEDARRMQNTLGIPLLDRLFESLCQGSDFDVKEDKCWEKIEVSSNPRQCSKLTDGNPETYWESNGSSGSHWINIFMKKGVVIRKLTVHVSQDDSSYMPARFVVMGGARPSDISHQLNVMTVSTTDNRVVILENEKKYWPVIRICIRRCQQGGIDTRIHGLEVVGPKPSFWPVLRQQLCIRTCLAYFVRARAWISSCTKKEEIDETVSKKQKIMTHGILNLSSKIIQAIQHEQEFADLFLPNDESSLVIGQAFRNAVINPLVTAVLDAGISDTKEDENKPSNSLSSTTNSEDFASSLIFQLLYQYVEMANSHDEDFGLFQMDRLEFLSRLRRLTRLLVDLNPTGPNYSRRTQNTGNGAKEWQQKMQTKSSKDDDSARTSRSKTSSTFEATSASKNATKEIEELFADELLDPTAGSTSWNPGLTPIAKKWCSVVTVRMLNFFNENLNLANNGENLETIGDSGLEFWQVLAKEYECLRKCTTELFGTHAQFLTALIRGINGAIGSLDIEQTVAFGRNVAITIHKLMMKSKSLQITRQDLKLLDHLAQFLFLSNNLDWGCVFEPLYCSLLASRLLNYDSENLDFEKQISNSICACFPDGRPNLMLQDASHSKNLWNGFIAHRMEMFDTISLLMSSDEIEQQQKLLLQSQLEKHWMKLNLYKNGLLGAQVVSPVSWRLKATKKHAVPDLLCQLKSDLITLLNDYETFFQSAYQRAVSPSGSSNSGPLHWTGEGWAEIVDMKTKQVYKVTTTQMLLLLHFNYDCENEVNIETWKQAFPHHWSSALDGLMKASILKPASETSFVLVNTNKTKMKTPVIDLVVCFDETEICNKFDDVKELTEKRNTIIDCAIIKCIKQTQSCQMDALLFNVTRQCLGEPIDGIFYDRTDIENTKTHDVIKENNSNYFLPLSSEIRARCDLLIDLGFIKQDPENPQILEYIAKSPPIRSRTSTICMEKESEAENDVTQATQEPAAKNEEKETTIEVNQDATVIDVTREISADGIQESDDDEWETATNSSSTSIPIPHPTSSPASTRSKSGAIPKNRKESDNSVIPLTPAPQDIVYPFKDLLSWHLVHGMSENPAIITLQRSCQSLTKDEIYTTIEKSITRISQVLSCDKSIVEALLLQMDWRVQDLIEHYVSNKSTLRAIGIANEEKESDENEDDLSEQGAAAASASTAKSQTSSSDNCCPICTNELTSSNSLALQCDHQCCVDCWKTYLTQKLDENQASNAQCPIEKCDARPTLETYERLFKDEKDIYERYKMVLVRSYVESDRSLTWCHCPLGCDMVVRKGSSWKNIGTCSACGWETCFACTYSESHYPASCGHMSQWLEDGGYFEGMGDDARSKHLARLIAKRCPNCQANIEKDDGCLHMKCLKCSHDFCWRCLKPWRPTHRDYYKCSAKVSKMAQAGLKFQDHNKRCQFHHKATMFPLGIVKRMMSVDATMVSPVKLTRAIRVCIILVKARKALAYSNIFSYYSVDTERMKTMELHSQVLENNTLKLQEFLDKTLLGVADINNALANLSDSDLIQMEENFSKIGTQLKSILTFSAQDMKVGLPLSKLLADGKTNRSNIVLHARPAGMSDDEHDDEDIGFGLWRRDATALESAVDRLNPVLRAWDEDDEDDDDDDDDDENNDEGNFPSSDDDTFDDDDDDDDDNRISDDTVGDYDMQYEEDNLYSMF